MRAFIKEHKQKAATLFLAGALVGVGVLSGLQPNISTNRYNIPESSIYNATSNPNGYVVIEKGVAIMNTKMTTQGKVVTSILPINNGAKITLAQLQGIAIKNNIKFGTTAINTGVAQGWIVIDVVDGFIAPNPVDTNGKPTGTGPTVKPEYDGFIVIDVVDGF